MHRCADEPGAVTAAINNKCIANCRRLNMPNSIARVILDPINNNGLRLSKFLNLGQKMIQCRQELGHARAAKWCNMY